MSGSVKMWQVIALMASGVGMLNACGFGGSPAPSPYPAPPVVVTSLSDRSLRFADTPVGAYSATLTTTLKNTDSRSFTITDIRLGGKDPTSFDLQTTCRARLAPAEECAIMVRFHPQAQSGIELYALVHVDIASRGAAFVALRGHIVPADASH